MSSKIKHSEEVVPQLRNMQDIRKLDSSTTLPSYDWVKYHSAHPSRVDNCVVSELDCNAFWGIIAKPVAMVLAF